jgi:hypothetical protein
MNTVWMRSPDGERKEVDAEPAELARLMNAGWSQCEPPAEQAKEANDHAS